MTFWLSTPQPIPISIPADVEVSTTRTESDQVTVEAMRSPRKAPRAGRLSPREHDVAGERRGGQAVGKRLAEIPGMVPSLREEIAGCVFAPRCAYATERCRREYPPLEEKGGGHVVACWEAERVAAGA